MLGQIVDALALERWELALGELHQSHFDVVAGLKVLIIQMTLKMGKKLPHPSVLYLCFRHWTFFNTKKSRLVLDYQPSIKFEDALNRCQMYYRHLQPQDIPSYSWSPVCA
nr:Hypothetical protein CBG03297 [Haemonchus contortus]